MTLKEKFQEWHDTPTNETIAENIIDLEQIADEFAIGFAEWCRENYIKHTILGNVKGYKELLEIYKKD